MPCFCIENVKCKLTAFRIFASHLQMNITKNSLLFKASVTARDGRMSQEYRLAKHHRVWICNAFGNFIKTHQNYHATELKSTIALQLHINVT